MPLFSDLVYAATRRIPAGRVATYGSIARAIGRPRAARAVGTALGKNPGLVAVPCHRVVRKSGQVGNYALGRRRKIALLRKEGVCIRSGKVDGRKFFVGLVRKTRKKYAPR